MFENAELGHTVSKEEYAKRSGPLRDAPSGGAGEVVQFWVVEGHSVASLAIRRRL